MTSALLGADFISERLDVRPLSMLRPSFISEVVRAHLASPNPETSFQNKTFSDGSTVLLVNIVNLELSYQRQYS